MTTKEFIKRVERLGYRAVMRPNGVAVKTTGNGTIAFICVSAEHKIDSYNALTISVELFDLMVEYAKTPVKEREEPEKYYLRAEGHEDEYGNYLNMRGGKVFISNSFTDSFCQTQFTEEEIAQMPKWCQALERIEVEE